MQTHGAKGHRSDRRICRSHRVGLRDRAWSPRRLPRRTRSGALRATHPDDDAPIKPGRLYVAPPGCHLFIEEGNVRCAAHHGAIIVIDETSDSRSQERPTSRPCTFSPPSHLHSSQARHRSTATSPWVPRILCPRTGGTCRHAPGLGGNGGLGLANREGVVPDLACHGVEPSPRTPGDLLSKWLWISGLTGQTPDGLALEGPAGSRGLGPIGPRSQRRRAGPAQIAHGANVAVLAPSSLDRLKFDRSAAGDRTEPETRGL